jgi:hypothetical protein
VQIAQTFEGMQPPHAIKKKLYRIKEMDKEINLKKVYAYILSATINSQNL